MGSQTAWVARLGRVLAGAAALAVVAACGGGGGSEGESLPAAVNLNQGNGHGARAPVVAVTDKGPVRGVDRLGMRSYFGIPYAAPPVGDLRWAPPAQPARWRGLLDNTASSAPCLQTSASPFRLAGGQEDCLYLDVHAPTGGHGPFPVMVWFHGGAFNTGGTATYADPSPLVSKGVVVVNVAYRLGAMGFLGHPALRATGAGGVPPGSVGNYGILDQQAALRWVKANIAAFAGDARNVTLFGESAGGFSVMTHLASPLSAGLFHKAIVQSGGYAFDRQLPQAALEAASTTIVDNALAAAGVSCPGGTVDAACLRSLPTSVVSTQLAAAFNASQSSPVPSIDGHVLPQSIKATFAAGQNNRVPLLNGSNQDEWSLFLAIGELGRRAAAGGNTDPANLAFVAPTAATYGPTLAGQAAGSGTTAAALLAAYPLAHYGGAADPLAPVRGATAQGTDFIFACPALNLSKRAAQQSTPVWMYEFRDQTALPSIGADAAGNPTVATPQRAAHSYEIQYLFNLRELPNHERRALQEAMSTYWTNFAQTGNPNRGAAVPARWPAFTSAATVLGLDVASGGGIQPLASFEQDHQCSSTWSGLTF
ncbi:MAG TPA: carboxylesterase family protein [Ramlibacter sp.]|uniref:carboxylesterase/lipase family protein n=1 Tax=Ramlibacter sp. TaxID=1917967 RepID=UPI002D43A0A4|nr:carboxylesterase family protein [Ramlibacter sp.]HZY18167.1 carboxylesterase family protein [Ramlibacter sp.]